MSCIKTACSYIAELFDRYYRSIKLLLYYIIEVLIYFMLSVAILRILGNRSVNIRRFEHNEILCMWYYENTQIKIEILYKSD